MGFQSLIPDIVKYSVTLFIHLVMVFLFLVFLFFNISIFFITTGYRNTGIDTSRTLRKKWRGYAAHTDRLLHEKEGNDYNIKSASTVKVQYIINLIFNGKTNKALLCSL